MFFLAPLAIAVRVMLASAKNLVKGLVVRGFMRNRQGTTGINIDLKIKDTKVKKKLRNVDRDINRIVQRALGRAAEFGRAGIVERTKQGLDLKKEVLFHILLNIKNIEQNMVVHQDLI